MGSPHSVRYSRLTRLQSDLSDFLPGLLTTMFAAAGTLLNTSKRAQSQGKVRRSTNTHPCLVLRHTRHVQPVRYNIDAWDEMMMDRDRRLTGHSRGQKARYPFACSLNRGVCSLGPYSWMLNDDVSRFQSDPIPPEGFDTSSAWYTQQTS